MANGSKPDYGAFVTRKSGEKNYYTRVGSAWNVSNDGISIKLEPSIAVTNDMVLFPPRDEE